MAPNMISRMRLDGFMNALSRLGIKGRDKGASNEIAPPGIYSFQDLTMLYMGGGLAKRIVDIVANDATRAGWAINGDADGKILQRTKELDLVGQMADLVRWQRLYGGGLLVKNYDDGKDPARALLKPYSGKKPKLIGIKTYSAARVSVEPGDCERDPTSARFELPNCYTVKTMQGTEFKVHWTRCEVLRGTPLPDPTLETIPGKQKFWGIGDVQAVIEDLGKLTMFLNGVATLGQEMTIGKYTLANLVELLATKDYESIEKRLELMALSKSVINGVILGEGEAYERDSLSFAGVGDVTDRFMQIVAGTAGIAVSILFGRAAAGMNSTGENDVRVYYDQVSSRQRNQLALPLLNIVRDVASEFGSDTDKISITFNPIWEPTQREKVEMANTQARTDEIYERIASITREEIRQNRFQGTPTFDTSVTGPAPTLEYLTELKEAKGGPGQQAADPEDPDEGKEGEPPHDNGNGNVKGQKSLAS